MATGGNDTSSKGGIETRIAEIKNRLETMAGGKLVAWESDALPDKAREQFWRRVMATEEGPWTTDFERLVTMGVELPTSESMDDETLETKLSEVIEALAALDVYISHTDHLPNRELYAQLWRDSLRHEIPKESDDDDGVWHIDLIGTGSEEDTHLYLKFYADDEERSRWLNNVTNDSMPAHEDPPYDRDRHLPKFSGTCAGRLKGAVSRPRAGGRQTGVARP
jgi:hypothetical protein